MTTKRSVELRDLDVLVAVVEGGSFRRAAGSLAIDPSAVSRRIRKLEDDLGAALFERNGSGVRLTAAGHRFYEDASLSIAQLDGAIRSVTAAGKGRTGTVSLGIVEPLASGFLRNVVQQFKQDHPEVDLLFNEGSQQRHIASVAAHTLDIAFVFGTPRSDVLTIEELWSEPIVAAVGPEDQRRGERHLPISAFAHDRFIVSHHHPGPETHDYITRSLSTMHFRPIVNRHRVGRRSLLSLVGLGFGTVLVCESEAQVGYPNVHFITIEGERMTFSMAWSPQNDNPVLRRLVSLARRLSRSEQKAIA